MGWGKTGIFDIVLARPSLKVMEGEVRPTCITSFKSKNKKNYVNARACKSLQKMVWCGTDTLEAVNINLWPFPH